MKTITLIPPSKHSKNVARDLVYGCWCKGKRIAGIQFPPVSQALVTTVVRDAGHDARLLDAAALMLSMDEMKDEFRREQVDVCIMLTSTMTIVEDAETLAQLKEVNPNMRTILSGSQATFMPQATLARPGVDFIVQREQEWIIRDLVNALQERRCYTRVNGIGYKNAKGKVVLNPPAGSSGIWMICPLLTVLYCREMWIISTPLSSECPLPPCLPLVAVLPSARTAPRPYFTVTGSLPQCREGGGGDEDLSGHGLS